MDKKGREVNDPLFPFFFLKLSMKLLQHNVTKREVRHLVERCWYVLEDEKDVTFRISKYIHTYIYIYRSLLLFCSYIKFACKVSLPYLEVFIV